MSGRASLLETLTFLFGDTVDPSFHLGLPH